MICDSVTVMIVRLYFIFQLGVMVMVSGIVLKWRLAPKHPDVCTQLCFSHPDTHNLSVVLGCAVIFPSLVVTSP